MYVVNKVLSLVCQNLCTVGFGLCAENDNYLFCLSWPCVSHQAANLLHFLLCGDNDNHLFCLSWPCVSRHAANQLYFLQSDVLCLPVKVIQQHYKCHGMNW